MALAAYLEMKLYPRVLLNQTIRATQYLLIYSHSSSEPCFKALALLLAERLPLNIP
jgi:hypothetical protein